ncbi:glycosyltransferase [Mesoflavibacter sp. SCSIO 43206]|uniref:glycosyltransferase n=1 Tax=Mesoflavibacter sp. SCSIO 43206 TaxID=2779362 RepID=UPI001CA814EE|nr:glycosyltransferase [Mesoflavibacter sp. SCSIO 43206]UAB75816.1 glycosyltransferase family 2 protein [Mesoflavibacter sp. SCSIO 43206]
MSDENLEVLISTMNRNSINFIYKMFEKTELSKFNVLIINQTTKDNKLSSKLPNVRVINSFEKGLSKSRNLALKNAKSKYVVIADDDLVYEKEFYKSILEAFKQNKDAAIISFEAYDDNGLPMRKYPNQSQLHSFETISKVSSREIVINLEVLNKNDIKFNENFGLGSLFETGEEQLFAEEVFKHEKCVFKKIKIVEHPYFTSGRESGSDRLIYARSALFYKRHGFYSYIKLLHYLFLVFKSKEISTNQIFYKLKIGLKGIAKYKELLRKGLEKNK